VPRRVYPQSTVPVEFGDQKERYRIVSGFFVIDVSVAVTIFRYIIKHCF